MKSIIEQIIAETAAHLERRVVVFDVQVSSLTGNRLTLQGKVLETAALHSLEKEINRVLPEVHIDSQAVQVLRKSPPVLRRVATNFTGQYAQPSWLAEMVTQVRNGMALEVLETNEKWAYVCQEDGYLGWVYQPYLGEEEIFAFNYRVTAPTIQLHQEPAEDSPVVTRLEAGTDVMARVSENGWSWVSPVGKMLAGGWTPAVGLTALSALPTSATEQRAAVLAFAHRMTGTPYLWGGCSAMGIDCSGLAQLAYRLVGIDLPRDADMQFAAGQPVEPPYQPGDLLFFGDTKITHVSISLGGWNIIHSSRARNGVYVDNIQEVPHLKESFAGGKKFI